MTSVNIITTTRFQYQGFTSPAELFCVQAGPQEPSDVILYLLTGYNASANDRWIQLATSISAASVPLVSIPVPAGQPFSWTPAPPGFRFKTRQAYWRISSTGDTYTAAADDFWVNAIGRCIVPPVI